MKRVLICDLPIGAEFTTCLTRRPGKTVWRGGEAVGVELCEAGWRRDQDALPHLRPSIEVTVHRNTVVEVEDVDRASR